MTDRFHSLTVTLEEDMREDDANALINAISQFRGVINVTGSVANLESHMAEQRAKHKLGAKLLEVLTPENS